MTKMEAVAKLIGGGCDTIIFKKSQFVLDDGSIVNKRSKKALDMLRMTEDGWDIHVEPKWYESLIGEEGEFKEFIGIVGSEYFHFIGADETNFNSETSSFEFDMVTPATADQVFEDLVFGGKPKPKKRKPAKKKEDPAVITGETDISQTGEQFSGDVEPAPIEEEKEIDVMEETTPVAEGTVVDALNEVDDTPPTTSFDEVPTHEEHYAESCMAEKQEEPPFDTEPVGNVESSQPESGTPGAKTTKKPKAESEYSGPPVLSGDYVPPSKLARYMGSFSKLGLQPSEWNLFNEWLVRKGYNLEKSGMVAEVRAKWFEEYQADYHVEG